MKLRVPSRKLHDPALQSLYDKLMASGNESLAKAHDVGIAVEKLAIADLKAAISETTQADARAAFTAAKDGRVLGARDGQGMQNGRSGSTSAGQARSGQGQGGKAGNGIRRGQQGTTRPTTCPVR